MRIPHCILIIAACIATGMGRPVESADNKVEVGEKWALLVGVDNYAHARRLKYAGRDIDGLYRRLRAMGFQDDHIVILNTREGPARNLPFRSAVNRQLRRLLGTRDKPGRVGKRDLVLVALSGHGISIPQKGSFFCPMDADLEDPATLLPIGEIFGRLENSSAAVKLLWIDACRNEARRERKNIRQKKRPSESSRQFAAEIHARCPEGVVMMTSCKSGQYSIEDEDLRHGVFLNFLLKGLDGDADRKENGSIGNANGRVSLKELFEYARTHTSEYVSKRYDSLQDPELKVSRKNRGLLEFEFGPYSARYPYTLEFQVRVNGPSGSVAPGAKVDIFHQASPQSMPQRLDGFRADGDGRGQLILRLDKRQRTSGTFVAEIEHRGARARQSLRELLERTRHHLYAPETTPYAERVEKLFKAGKYHELMDLVWKNWAKSSKVIRDRFVVAMGKKPDWLLLQAEKEVARESRPEFAAAAWAAIARQWKARGDVARFQSAIRQVNAKCLNVKNLQVAVRLRLAILEDLAPVLTGSAADKAVYLELVRLVKVSTDTIPAAGRNYEEQYLRHRAYVRLAALSYRRGSVRDANYYLKLAYAIIHPAGAFYWDLPAYACIMTRLRADDLDSAMKYPHVNPSNGQVRLYMLSGKRGFVPLERIPTLTQHMKLNLRDSESAWEARLTCELARAFAARGAALRYRARIDTAGRATLLRAADRLFETALKYERLGETRLEQLKHTSRPSVSLESRRLLAEATAYRLFRQGASVTASKIAAYRQEVAGRQANGRRRALDAEGLARMLATHGGMLVSEGRLQDAESFLRDNAQRWNMLPVLYSFGRALRTESNAQLTSTIDWANRDADAATRAALLAGLADAKRNAKAARMAGARAFAVAETLPAFRVDNRSNSRLYILLIERPGTTGKRHLVEPGRSYSVPAGQSSVMYHDGTAWRTLNVAGRRSISFQRVFRPTTPGS